MHRRRFVAVVCAAALAAGSGTDAGADVEPVELAPVTFQDAELVLAGPDGEKAYEPAEIEAFGTYRMVTTTPWRDEPTAFEGPLLGDLLAAHGLGDVPAIRVTAEDQYSVVLPREAWTERPVLLATRVAGKPHSRRAHGPLQLVFPLSDEPELGEGAFAENWVWMVSRIEPAE